MLSLKPLLAHRLTSNQELYPSIVEEYIQAIMEAAWRVKIWALSGQKPVVV